MPKQQQIIRPSASPDLSALFFISLTFPVLALVFLTSGPHTISAACYWILPFWLILFADLVKIKIKPVSKTSDSHLPFSLLLYLLAALQICNIWFMLEMASQLEWSNPAMISTSLVNLLAIKVIIGTSSSFSGIVTAHELIHKRTWYDKLLGRLLLSLVCYEHFFTEHLHGHHCNVGRENDPATARFGESFNAYWKRTVPDQFKQAWQLENRRIKLQGIKFPAIFQHHVFQGIVFEAVLILLIAHSFGISALFAFLIQALAAIRKLEAVNYIEHWGLERSSNTSRNTDILSWETNSWLTLHSLLGLSRHTDHHQHPDKPYQQLEYCASSPQLPYGYFATIFLSIFANARFQSLATQQLQINQLGPFQPHNTQRAA